MRFGPSSIHCWTSEAANSTSRLQQKLSPRRTVMKTIYIGAIAIAGLSAVVALAANGPMGTTPSSDAPKVESVADGAGNLHVPDGYRNTYQFLGSWAVASNQGQGSKELHVVYVSPGTITAYRKDGRFPNGAVLVKEVFEAATAGMTTGTVSHAETLKGWFVMIRDGDGRYA